MGRRGRTVVRAYVSSSDPTLKFLGRPGFHPALMGTRPPSSNGYPIRVTELTKLSLSWSTKQMNSTTSAPLKAVSEKVDATLIG